MRKVAVVGAGHFGREHARIYSTSENAQLVAVCDINETNGRPVAERFGARYITDFRELIGEVDAVSLAVPTESHHAIASALIDAASGISGDTILPYAINIPIVSNTIETANASLRETTRRIAK